MDEQLAFSVREFCARHSISPATYWNLKKVGKGPREIWAGNKILISREAAADWRMAREAESATAAA